MPFQSPKKHFLMVKEVYSSPKVDGKNQGEASPCTGLEWVDNPGICGGQTWAVTAPLPFHTQTSDWTPEL